MYSTSSFTEKAFLNSAYLQYLYPPERKEVRVEHPHESIIDTLKEVDLHVYAAPSKGLQHRVLKPVRAVARAVYSIFVAVVVAPIGVLYHGVQAVKNRVIQQPEKVRCHLESLKVDLKTSVIGVAFAAATIAYPIFACSYYPVISAEFAAAGFFGCGAFLPGIFAADTTAFLAGKKSDIGLFLSLTLRNELGLVGPDGNLLPFNASDEDVEWRGLNLCTNLQGGPARPLTLLHNEIIEAEKKLIHKIREVNVYASQHGHRGIAFVYPFNGQELASRLQKVYKNTPLQESVESIDALGKKIDFLRNLFLDIRRLAPRATERIENQLPDSLLPMNAYRNLFING